MKNIFLTLLIFLGLLTFFDVLATDYTQPCGATGTAICKYGEYCGSNPECYGAENCDYSCPDSLPNSSNIGNSCNPFVSWNCTCAYLPNLCNGETQDCQVSGDCQYECNEGYYWDGDSCEESPVPEQIEYIEDPENPERFFYLDKSFTYADLYFIGLSMLVIFVWTGKEISNYFSSK